MLTKCRYSLLNLKTSFTHTPSYTPLSHNIFFYFEPVYSGLPKRIPCNPLFCGHSRLCPSKCLQAH